MGKTLYQQALDAVNELFSDTSVSQQETLNSSNALVEEIEVMKEALENEIEKEG